MKNNWKISIALISLCYCSFSATPNSMIFNDFPLVFDDAWKNYKDSTVEHYHVDSAMQVSGALGEYGKTVFFFDGKKPKLEGNYLNTLNGYIAQSKSFYTFDNDNYGYTTSNYVKNSTKGTWDISDSMKLRFNGADRIMLMEMYVWDSTGIMMDPRVMNFYRDVNNRTDSVILKVSGVVSGVQMARTTKYTYFYDNQNRYAFRIDTTKTEITGAPIEVPVTIAKHTFTYTPGAMTIVHRDSISTGWSLKDSIYTALLNDSTLSFEEKYLWNDTTSKWIKSLKKVFTYNTNGTCATETNYGKNADTGWAIISKTCFYYDNYSGPALPSLDESAILVKVPSGNNKALLKSTVVTYEGKHLPGQIYTLTGRKSTSALPLLPSAMQRFIRE